MTIPSPSRIPSPLLALLAIALALPPAAWAGSTDVELFSGGSNVPPNILLLLDNSASMDRTVTETTPCDASDATAANACKRKIASKAIEAVVNTVNPVVAGTREENARFGLMSYVTRGASVEVPIANGSSDSVISGAAALTSRGVGTPINGSILDAGRYYAGSRQWDKDGTGTGAGLPLWGAITTVSPPETVLADPIDIACRDSFVIFITDGLPSSDVIDKAGFWDTVGDADGDTGTGEGMVESSANVGVTNGSWGDDITWAMARYDFRPDLGETQNVITHMIGFTVDDPLLQRMAQNGLGSYYVANDAAALGTALDLATQEVFDRFADFSTAVVPTSRTLSGSAFYNAYFEPGKLPIWPGHLEAYRLSPQGEILDKDGNAAVDSVTDLLIEPHNPYWDAATGLASNASRALYTTIAGAREDFASSNASVSEALLGVVAGDLPFYKVVTTTAELRGAVIGYVHGQDAFDDDGDSNTSELRRAVLGDIFHSTPRIVAQPSRLHVSEPGYATFRADYLDRDRVIYAGANDGLLHAFDAGAYATGDDPDTTPVESAGHVYHTPGSGSERFGYVPGLLLDKLKKLPLNYPRTFYYVDGSPVHAEAWLGDGSGTDTSKSDDEWATVLVTGFREGGAGYLALDVTDPDAVVGDDHYPYPALLWEFTHASLGQAWSEAVITRVKVKGAASSGDHCGANDGDGDCREQWVAIVGGGYLQDGDPNLDAVYKAPADAGWTDTSKAIFMIALDTGNLIAMVGYDATDHPDMVYSIPSAPAVLDLDQDGFADVVYIGDLGGQLWKWDIHSVGADGVDVDTLVDNWPAGVYFESAPVDMGSGVYHYRSIFFPPAASYDRGVLNLAFGTGEREDLRYAGDSTKDENNRFYVVQDRYPTGAYAFLDPVGDPRLKTEADLSDVTAAKIDSNLNNSGFYFVAEEGEKFTSDVVVFAGYVITTTYTPHASDICTAATGQALLYAFRVRDAHGLYDDPSDTAAESRRMAIGPGLASSPRVSMAPDPDDDKVFVKTSKAKILPVTPPERENSGASVIYWRQNY